jgi:hypothetical protein
MFEAGHDCVADPLDDGAGSLREALMIRGFTRVSARPKCESSSICGLSLLSG